MTYIIPTKFKNMINNKFIKQFLANTTLYNLILKDIGSDSWNTVLKLTCLDEDKEDFLKYYNNLSSIKRDIINQYIIRRITSS